MMAAMAQQDCGQCGYNCKDYSERFSKERGAAEPLRAGRQGNRPNAEVAVRGDRQGARRSDACGGNSRAAARSECRSRPFARQSRDSDISRPLRLNKPGSEKETWHLEFDLSAASLDYVVGDAFGLFPQQRSGARGCRIEPLGAPADFRSAAHAARRADRRGVALARAGHRYSSSFPTSPAASGGRRQRRSPPARIPDGDAATLDVLAALQKFPGIRPDPEAFIEVLEPLQPRLYSISSSPKVDPGRVALTVDAVRYDDRGRDAARRRLDLPGRAHQCRRADPGLCAEGARLRPAGRSDDADHHDRPGHRRRAVPRLPARAHGDEGARAQLAVLRPSAPRLRFLLRGRIRRHEGDGRAHAPRRSPGRATASRNSTCRTACARSAATCGHGSPTARTSMSAATPSAWRRMWSARWSTSWRSTARARPTRRSPSSPT